MSLHRSEQEQKVQNTAQKSLKSALSRGGFSIKTDKDNQPSHMTYKAVADVVEGVNNKV